MRALPALLVVALAGCSFSPSTSKYKPRSAGDCPGQKACGYLCVDQDDPAAGCGSTGCDACPSGAAHTVPVCLAVGQCGLECEVGYAAPDGDPAHGCAAASATDAANCGSPGHACAGGESCVGGLCTASDAWTSIGAEPRGLAVLDAQSVAWANDPSSGLPQGSLSRIHGGVRAPALGGMGHPTWVRREAGRSTVAVAATDPDDATILYAYAIDAADGTEVGWFGGMGESSWIGLALVSRWAVTASTPSSADSWASDMLAYDSLMPGFDVSASITFTGAALEGFGEGAGLLWLGHAFGVTRIRINGTPDSVDRGMEPVEGGGVPFAALLGAPHPHRIAARTGTGAAGTAEVYFADLSDGSIWVGVAGTATAPRRIVRGNGARSQMDLAADDGGVVWSDLDRGEIWTYRPETGNPPYLLARGRPWAIALTADRVYWTDVDAEAIRSVAR